MKNTLFKICSLFLVLQIPFSECAATPMVYAGSELSLAINVDGNVATWGVNTLGQLGNGSSSANSLVPTFASIKNVVSLAPGLDFVLALKTDKTASAWGNNTYGKLGNGKNTVSKSPTTVTFLTSEASAFAAGSTSSYAQLIDGTVISWGQNVSGQLGNGTTTDSTNAATKVINLTDVAKIVGGPTFAYALKADGSLWGWGAAGNDVLTSAAKDISLVPVKMLEGVKAMAAGATHGLAVKTDGTVLAWGSTVSTALYSGEVGPSPSATPVEIPNLSEITDVSAGNSFSLALRRDGTVWGWGLNADGQLGNGSNTNSDTPVQVSGLNSVVAIAAGATHTLALKSDGTVWTWGSNSSGQLGNGTTKNSNVPVQVVGVSSLGFLNLSQSTSSSSSSSTTGSTGNVNTTYTTPSQSGNVNTTYADPSQSPTYNCSPSTAKDYERLFLWVEGKYAALFFPPAVTKTLADYTYRYYQGSNSFLGFRNGIVYFYQPSSRSGNILSLGNACIFLQKAQNDGY